MIELKLELTEVNGILMALGQMPYVQVKDLIAKIQVQAQGQLKEDKEQP